jgi:hypothetical protein
MGLQNLTAHLSLVRKKTFYIRTKQNKTKEFTGILEEISL